MTPTNHPAPESEREAVKRIIRDGFNSGSSITAIADAILSRRMGAEPIAWMTEGDLETLKRGTLAIVHPHRESDRSGNEASIPLYASPPAPALDPACMQAIATKEPCRPAGDNHLRCAICGFIVDTSFEATKPTIDFTMQGRSKKAPAPALDARTVEACAKICDRWIASKNLHEHLAATDIKAEILAIRADRGK